MDCGVVLQVDGGRLHASKMVFLEYRACKEGIASQSGREDVQSV